MTVDLGVALRRRVHDKCLPHSRDNVPTQVSNTEANKLSSSSGSGGAGGDGMRVNGQATDDHPPKWTLRRGLSFCGSLEYMPPEMLLCRPHDQAVDWWALGVLLYELVAGYNPFQGMSAPATYSNIVQSSAGSMHLPPTFPQLLCEMVRALLETEPSKRLGASIDPGSGGAAAVKAHPWFAAVGPFDFEVGLIVGDPRANILHCAHFV